MWLRLVDATLFPPVYFLVLAASVCGGYLIARYRYVARGRKWTPSGVESSVIGFFSLVVSFTLSSSYSSSHNRNTLIHREGDAVAQLYRASFSSPEPLQSEVRQYLLQHIDTLRSFYDGKESVSHVIHAITVENERFWAVLTKDTTGKGGNLSSSYNQLSSATYTMLYSYEERTPLLIMWLLILASWLIGLLVGFMNGFYERTHLLVPLLYIILVSFTLKAIRDLDNPLQGAIRPDVKNLEELRQVIQANRN